MDWGPETPIEEDRNRYALEMMLPGEERHSTYADSSVLSFSFSAQ